MLYVRHLGLGFVVDGEPSHEKGELTVEALGQDGGTLARTQLLIDTPCGDRDGETAQAVCGLIAFPEKAMGLRVSRHDDVLFEQSAPAKDLEVKVEWPGSLSATETVHWRGSADECIASLGYSNDGGETWTAIALPGPSNTIDVDANALPGGGDCLLELIVSDGFHTRRIRSDAYQVSRKGWAPLDTLAGSGSEPPRRAAGAARGAGLPLRGAPGRLRRHRVGVLGHRRPGYGSSTARNARAG